MTTNALPQAVTEILDAARDKWAEKDMQVTLEIEEKAESFDNTHAEFVQSTIAPLVPEPLRPYLRWGWGVIAGIAFTYLEIPGIAPLIILHDEKRKEFKFGVVRFSEYFDNDGDLSHDIDWSEGGLDEALGLAHLYQARGAATSAAHERAAKLEQERKERETQQANPLRLAKIAADLLNNQNAIEATAAALVSIAYSLINRQE